VNQEYQARTKSGEVKIQEWSLHFILFDLAQQITFAVKMKLFYSKNNSDAVDSKFGIKDKKRATSLEWPQ